MEKNSVEDRTESVACEESITSAQQSAKRSYSDGGLQSTGDACSPPKVLCVDLSTEPQIAPNEGTVADLDAACPVDGPQEKAAEVIKDDSKSQDESATVMLLEREALEMLKNPPEGCSAGPEEDLYSWLASVVGPDGSPYEDGVFKLRIYFLEDYPMQPPMVKFITPVYHCNIDRYGNVWADVLEEQWTPVLRISNVLQSIISLLADCNPHDTWNARLGKQFLESRAEFDAVARKWTRKYAHH